MIRSVLSFLLFFSLANPATAEADVRVRSYEIEASFEPVESWMKSRCIVHFELPVAGSVSFYLHGELSVTGISVDGRERPFEQEAVFYRSDYSRVAKRVSVELGSTEIDRVEIEYEGYFHASAARSPSDYMRVEKGSVLLRAYGYSPWFPIFLEPEDDAHSSDFEVTISTPAPLVSVFTGRLVERRDEEGMSISRWSAPATPLYAAQVTARDYAVQSRDGVYAYSLKDARSREAARELLDLARKLEERFRARYRSTAAGSELHLMQMPKYGDISSGNVIGLSDDTWLEVLSSPYAQRTLAHELVHSYVRPEISVNDPAYALVIEGFPSYFHLPVLEEIGWSDSYDQYMDRLEARYLEQRRTGKSRRGWNLPKEKPILELTPGDIRDYKDLFVLSDRVLLFFDYLRRTLGKERFDDMVRTLFERPSITAESLRALILERAPDLEDDLSLWLDTTEFPERFHRREGS